MHVELSSEQALLAETTARLAAHAGATDDLWATVADAGLLALAAPAQAGGAGATAVEVALVAEALGAELVAVPFLAQGVVAPALLVAAGADVTAVATGRLRLAVQLTPDLAGFGTPGVDGVALGTEGAEGVLTVGSDGAVRRHLLEGSPLAALDRSQPLRAGRPEDGDLVGRATPDDLARVEALALAALSADALGAAGRALALAVEHAGAREQFGRPIGSFQAVQHLLAHAAVLVEGMRSCTWHAAWAASALDAGGALLAARQAKAWCGRSARTVVEIAVQCLGGVAITWEHPAHRLLRRVLADDALLGATGTQMAGIAAARLGPDGDREAEVVPAPVAGLDYADSPGEAALRADLRRWLVEHDAAGDGDDPEVRHRWHRELAAGGWVGVSFPAEDGGRGGTPVDEAIVNEELARAGTPPTPAIGHLAHALRLFGTTEQRAALLPPLLAGAERWCQGFSEPGAGSDLAALATRAERDGDRYRVTGQKVWTSEAVGADHCLLLARTETDGPAHGRLSMLVVPMTAPGVDVRPITTAYGSDEFAEVFLDDVVVPAAAVLGRPGQGWEIAMALLGFERGPSDIGWTARLGRRLADLEAAVRTGRRAATPVQRHALAGTWCDLETLRLHVLRTTFARRDGSAPGPEGSIDKLLMIEADQRLGHLVLDLLGADAVVDEGAAFPGYVWSRAQSIFGGTQQIQRTIVAQRVLGLPREPRPRP